MLRFAMALSARPRSWDRAAMARASSNLPRAHSNRLFLTSAYPSRIKRLKRAMRSGVMKRSTSFPAGVRRSTVPPRARAGEIDEIAHLLPRRRRQRAVAKEQLLFCRRDIGRRRETEQVRDVHLENFQD